MRRPRPLCNVRGNRVARRKATPISGSPDRTAPAARPAARPGPRSLRRPIALMGIALAFVLADVARSSAQLPWRAASEWEVWCATDLREIAFHDDPEEAKDHFAEILWEAEKKLDEDDRKVSSLAELRERLDDGFHDGVIEPLTRACFDELRREAAEGVLSRASEWLESTGIGGPDLSERPEALQDHFPFLSNRSPNCGVFYCAVVGIKDHSTLGWYQMAPRVLYLSPSVLNDAVGGAPRGTTGERFTAVHELFHAVQEGYEVPWGDTHDWIAEGTADYVEHVYQEMRGFPGPVWTKRYDRSLHVPPPDPGGDGPPAWWSYGSWSFWDFLGETLGMPEEVGYLDAVLRADLTDVNGLRGVDEALRGLGSGEGLYELFPEFVRLRLEDPRWFEDPSELTVELGPDEDRSELGHVEGDPEAVAADLVMLTTEVRGEPARLTVRVGGMHREGLHLIVDRGLAFRTDDGQEFTAPAPSGEKTWSIRVVNIEVLPAVTGDNPYDLTVLLDRVDPCDPDAMIAAVERGMTAGLVPAQLEAHGGGPGLSRDSLRSAMRQLAPVTGRGSLSIGGVVNDGGEGCTQPLGRIMGGGGDAGAPERGAGDREDGLESLEGVPAEVQARIERATREVFGKSASEMTDEEFASATPEQQGEWMRLMGMGPERATETTWRDRKGDVVIRVHSPNAQLAVAGIATPFDAVHEGTGGWRSNAAADITLRLDDVAAADLEEGSTYRAVPPVARPGAPPIVYARWEGESVSCDEPPIDRCFVGTSRFVTAEVTGRVTIEEITGSRIEGRFDLAGPARLYVRTGRVDGEGRQRTEESDREGTITVSGRFQSPVERDSVD